MTGLLTNAQRSYHFDVRQFHRMMAAGIFDDQKVELVAGKIYAMTDLPPHIFAVGRLHETLRAVLLRDEWTIREEKPVLIGRYWAPKPDIAVLRGSDTIYVARHPRPRDVGLLAEVSDTYSWPAPTQHEPVDHRQWSRPAWQGRVRGPISRLLPLLPRCVPCALGRNRTASAGPPRARRRTRSGHTRRAAGSPESPSA
jgi:hypothetical protein